MSGRTSGQDDDHAGPGPQQRPWIHPSELPAERAPDAAPPAGTAAHRLSLPVSTGLAGAVIAFGVAALMLGGDRANPGTGPSRAGVLFPSSLGTATGPVAGVTGSAAPAIVGVTAWEGAMPQYGSGVSYPPPPAAASGDVTPPGLVVTTRHLVDGATGVEVVTADGRSVMAEVIGTDPDYDLALLRVELPGLPALDFSPPLAAATVGADCVLVAAGHASAEDGWAARGVIASRGRVVHLDGTWMIDVLEIDARMASEGAGGAVLDASGALIGLLTTPGHDGADGANPSGVLAVPAARAARSIEQILDKGRVDHSWLGLAATDVDAPDDGALVRAVDEAGPAAAGGIVAGDVVIGVGARAVRTMTGLLREVRRHEVGETVVVRVRRGGDELDLTVTLEARPEREPPARVLGANAGVRPWSRDHA